MHYDKFNFNIGMYRTQKGTYKVCLTYFPYDLVSVLSDKAFKEIEHLMIKDFHKMIPNIKPNHIAYKNYYELQKLLTINKHLVYSYITNEYPEHFV